MSERDVWFSASEILTEYGAGSIAYIVDQLGDVIDNRVAVEDWRRIATAIDVIIDSPPQ